LEAIYCETLKMLSKTIASYIGIYSYRSRSGTTAKKSHTKPRNSKFSTFRNRGIASLASTKNTCNKEATHYT